MQECDKMIYDNEVDCLKHYSNNCYVVEIGAYKGYSTILMGPLSSYIISIDTFMSSGEGFKEREGEPTYDEFMENTAFLNDKHRVIVGDSHDISVINKIPNNIEFLFIDGDHTYLGCLADLINYVPKIVLRGIVALHDYGMMYPTVMAACVNYFKRLPDEVHGTIAIYKLDLKVTNKTVYYICDKNDQKN